MKLTRRDVLKLSPASLAMSTIPLTLKRSQALSPRKNVLLIIADDLGRDLGVYGNRILKTPRLDRLAREGTRFLKAFVTTSSCSPSRAVMYSGLYSHTAGQWGLAGKSNIHSYNTVESVPAILENNGYRTALIGKYHVLPDEVYPFGQHLRGGRNTAEIAQTAEEFFLADNGQPFFLVVCPSDPHRDVTGGFANNQDYPGLTAVTYDPASIRLPYFMADVLPVRQDVANYYQAISRLDQGIGMLLDKLEQSGFAQETLVIFTSDNGSSFPGAKVNLYDPGIRVPLIVKSPVQTQRGVIHRSMVSLLDIAPTILDWVGLSSPHLLPGKSILPALENERQQGWSSVYFSHMLHGINRPYFMRGIRTYRYKFIWNIMYHLPFTDAGDVQRSAMWRAIIAKEVTTIGGRLIRDYIYRPRIEFYDLRMDPHEINNLVEDPAFSALVQQYMNLVMQMMEKTDDGFVLDLVASYRDLDALLEA